ncbi:MAG: glycosyltransferase family 4 protein [Planctomycetes bacterium]|nr:glycosyltransferase family 4 protein [Planctomycetota bacterium]
MTDRPSQPKTVAGPPRLALVAAPGTTDDLGRTLRHLAVGLLDEPMELTVVVGDRAEAAALPIPPIEVLTFRPGRLGRPGRRAVRALAESLARRRVEMLHALDARAHRLTKALSRAGDWPYLVSVHDLRHCHRLGDLGPQNLGIIASSDPLREALLAARAAPPERIHLIRPGVHLARTPSYLARPGHDPAIVAAGSMAEAAPFETVLAAFAAIRAEGTACSLFLLGGGRAETHLRRRVASMKLVHDVTFVDVRLQRTLAGALDAADVLICPQSPGRVEMRILEAMAAGTAVLMGGPSVGDFVIDGQTALRYHPDRMADLTAKLRTLLTHPADAAGLAQRARDHVRDRHSPSQMVAALADLYRQWTLRGRTLATPPPSRGT